MAVDAVGRLWYTWVGDDHLPYIASSTDRGLTWSDPIMIAPPDVDEAALARRAGWSGGRRLSRHDQRAGRAPYYDFCNVYLGD